MIGQLVGSYRIVRALGEGGMGVVYLAEHTAQHAFAAIKMLLPRLSHRADMVRRFFDEARAATAIADPGIVRVHDVGFNDDGVAYIVMEALVGEALDARLRLLRRLPATVALCVARQLAGTLGAAHAAGIVHCDLKPENVFLAADPSEPGGERAKVLDFGVARLAGATGAAEGSGRAMALGTPQYMSPEQCRGAVELDGRADIYALGCVLYRMLVGRAPFVSKSPETMMAMHLYETAPPPSVELPALGGALDTLVMRCLAKAPAERYTDMAEVVEEIDRRYLTVAQCASTSSSARPASVRAALPTH